jgi:hypothetical protein
MVTLTLGAFLIGTLVPPMALALCLRRPDETRWSAFWRIWFWPFKSTWARATSTAFAAAASVIAVILIWRL